MKEKLKTIEGSKSFGLIVLFGLVVSIGLFIFYKNHISLEDREKKENSFEIISEARIIEISPVQHLSMDFEGNKVQTLAYKITYEYQFNNEIIRSTDIIKNRETKLSEWKTVEKLRIADKVKVKLNKQNFQESILYLNPE